MTDINASHDHARGPEPVVPFALAGMFRGASMSGEVYGVALNNTVDVRNGMIANDRAKAAPNAPVMFIKPRNTYLAHGSQVLLSPELDAVEPCAALGVVFGRDTARVAPSHALEHVLGYTLAIDISEPGAGYFRPPIREKCRDGFLPIGPGILPRHALEDPDAALLRLEVDGETVASVRGKDQIRPIAELIAEVSAYMTFSAGDMLLAVLTSPGPLARPGSRVAAVVDGIGRLECVIGREAEALS